MYMKNKRTRIFFLRQSCRSGVMPLFRLCMNDIVNRISDIRRSSTQNEFKSKLRKQINKVNDFLSVGDRKYNIILTRIRHNCSSLKADLHRVNIVPNPICDCGIDIENAGHYFFFCTQYNDQRDNLFSANKFHSVR